MAKRKQATGYIRGTAAHRRTEGDYMGVLLDTVTLDDWRGVVGGALQAAKGGDSSARAWLAQYLVGRPEHKAPTPLTVVVQQLNGTDPLVDRLSQRVIFDAQFPDDAREQQIKALVAAELVQKIPHPETIESPATARLPAESAGNGRADLADDLGKS
ncbi:MAG: hypothetical protein Q8L56_03530 [Rhodocyclaceae bacterium]|nr:hypothetical protein [Rhodocyclaceae bacterium]